MGDKNIFVYIFINFVYKLNEVLNEKAVNIWMYLKSFLQT